jgi:hypothetical protein
MPTPPTKHVNFVLLNEDGSIGFEAGGVTTTGPGTVTITSLGGI